MKLISEERTTMSIVTIAATITVVLVLGIAATPTFAARNPGGTGQPNVTCGSSGATQTPGNSDSANGSPFNEQGTSGKVYAGSGPGSTNHANSDHAVSQYDISCFQQSSHH